METKLLEGLNILLVEEEALIAMDIEQLCYEHGAATVAVSANGTLAPETLDAGKIDAAILDVKVGDSWTGDLARQLREHRIPFIFATSYTNAEPFFAEFPGVALVPKPYRGTDLTRALADAIARFRSGDRASGDND